MEALFQVCLSNTMVALVLAAAAAIAGRLRVRPAMVHGLWVLVLLKLVTPPVAPVAAMPGRVWPWSSQAPGVRAIGRRPNPADLGHDPAAGRMPAKPAGESGKWVFERNSRSRTLDQAVPIARRLMAEGRLSAPPVQPRPDPRRDRMATAWARGLAGPLLPATHRLALGAWLGVAGAWWGRTAWRLHRSRRLLAWAAPAPEAVQDRARGLAARLGIRRTPVVWFVPAPIAPMLWALASRPRLLVPEALWHRLGPDQRSALLVHELAHYRRRDHWVRILEIAALGLHWWNPLVWWARRSLREVEERCCDAWVNSALPGRARDYALAIVETLDFLAGEPALEPMGGTGLTSASRLKERLTHILGGATARPLSRPSILALLGLSAAAMGLRPGLPASHPFRIMDLGNLGGESTIPSRINDRGEVIGQSAVADWTVPGPSARRPPHTFRTAPNRPIDPATDDLSRRVGASDELDDRTFGVAINDSGQVVVSVVRPSRSPGVEDIQRGFFIDGRRVVELDPAVAPRPVALNDAGLVAVNGRRRIGWPDPPPRRRDDLRPLREDRIALRISPDRAIDPIADDIGNLGGFERTWGLWGHSTTIVDMNAAGQVVGSSSVSDGMPRTFRTRPGRPLDASADDLIPPVARGRVTIHAMNDRGEVIGVASVDEILKHHSFYLDPAGRIVNWGQMDRLSRHAFRAAPDRPIDPATDDLGTLGGPDSTPRGINNRGDVVGESDTRDGRVHAFLYTEGRMIDLNTCVDLPAGWVLESAHDINDRGQIVAVAVEPHDYLRGRRRGYLLTPAPEPIPMAMLLVGAAVTTTGLAIRRGGRRPIAPPADPGGPAPGRDDPSTRPSRGRR